LSRFLAERKIYGVLFDRLMRKEAGRSGSGHAAATLKKLLAGNRVTRLSDAGDDLRWPETRLYFDGVLEERDRQTEFRCEAASIAAERALAIWEAQPS
jgi:hypothetical protein